MKPWKTVALGDAAEFIRGITFKPDNVVPIDSAGAVACMRTKNVQAELDCSDVWGVDERLVRKPSQFLEMGDILVSSANSWNLVGKCCWIPKLQWRATFGGFVSVLRPRRTVVDPRFLYRWFSSAKIQTVVRSFGQQTTNISNLNTERCKSLPLPLPPLPEQRRIADVLDQAEALRVKRRAALAQLDTLAQSIFFDMFGDPATNPKRMRKESLGELIKLKSGDFLPAAKMSESGTYPVLGGNGINGFHDQYMFEDSRIVIGRVGVYCGCVHVSPPRSWVTDNALYISECSSGLAIGYLAHALTHARLNQYASQSGQPLVSGSRLYPVQILVPSAELQDAFVRRIAAVEKVKAAHRHSLAELDALVASLQHRAFCGEL